MMQKRLTNPATNPNAKLASNGCWKECSHPGSRVAFLDNDVNMATSKDINRLSIVKLDAWTCCGPVVSRFMKPGGYQLPGRFSSLKRAELMAALAFAIAA